MNKRRGRIAARCARQKIMTARQLRRAAERKANKLARKQATAPNFAEADAGVDDLPERAVCEMTEARLQANRANAQFSTGPTSVEGKAI